MSHDTLLESIKRGLDCRVTESSFSKMFCGMPRLQTVFQDLMEGFAQGSISYGTPLQYSCLENPMDGGAWWAVVHGVAKSQTRLSDFTFTFHFHAFGEGNGNPLQCSCLENRGCRLWGRTESDTTEVTQQQQQYQLILEYILQVLQENSITPLASY